MRSTQARPCSCPEAGYSLLMVVFFVATTMILAVTAVPNLLTQGRRERETEMIWRGEQYERAIGLYFRKFGRYPSKVEDLTRLTNGERFLRQAYKDPTNKEDGSWRFIYVGPNGQLTGSVRNVSLLQGLMSGGANPTSSLIGPGATPPPPPPAGAGAAGTNPPGAPQSTVGLAPNPIASQPQPLGGTVIGGNIIGIGSKTKESSLRVYKNGDTYEQWEFVWNPLQQNQIPGQQTPLTPLNGPANPGQQQRPGQIGQQPPGAFPPEINR